MTKEDQAAKERAWSAEYANEKSWYVNSVSEYAGKEIFNAGWDAAYAYKQKCITELEGLLYEAGFFVQLHREENGEPNGQVIDLNERIEKALPEGGGDDL